MSTRALIVAVTLALAAIVPAAALATDPKIRWADIIGIIQAGNVVGSGTGAVAGGGQPWSTTKGSASVNLNNGKIHFRVEGLVLAGGNSIGTRGAIAEVKGTLVCDTNGSAGGSGNSTLVDTPLVPLSAQGDAEFHGSVGPLPGACLSEPDIAFVVRTAGGAWIANGAVRRP